jgi:hypothetical protein
LPTLVDCTHGKIALESRIEATYKPNVYVDGYIQTENPPGTTDGDYDIDYESGQITFNSSVGGGVVTVDYSEVGDSDFYLTPIEGKQLVILKAELQFSNDVSMRDAFVFEVQADVSKFPALFPLWDQNPLGPPGPFPAGTYINLENPVVYKTVMDIQAEANISYPVVKKSTNVSTTWRDLQSDVQIFSWNYVDQAAIELSSVLGMRIRMSLQSHTPCAGWASIATFYCISETDPYLT